MYKGTAQACEQQKKKGLRSSLGQEAKIKSTNKQATRHAAFEPKRHTKGRKKNARMLGTIKTSITPALTPTKTCTAQACEQAAKKKRKRVPAWAEKQKKRSKKKGITYNQKLRHAAFDRKRPTQGRKKNDRMLGTIKTSRTPALRRTKTCMARARAHGHMKAVGTPLEIDSL